MFYSSFTKLAHINWWRLVTMTSPPKALWVSLGSVSLGSVEALGDLHILDTPILKGLLILAWPDISLRGHLPSQRVGDLLSGVDMTYLLLCNFFFVIWANYNNSLNPQYPSCQPGCFFFQVKSHSHLLWKVGWNWWNPFPHCPSVSISPSPPATLSDHGHQRQ